MPREHHGLPPGQAIRRMAEGYQVSAALRTMVVLDLADHLAAGPRTVVELALATGTHVPRACSQTYNQIKMAAMVTIAR